MMGNTLLDVKIAAKAEGKAEGEAKGETKGKAAVLLTLLRLKFPGLPEGTEARVRSASAEQLDAWAAAILTASTLDELLAVQP